MVYAEQMIALGMRPEDALAIQNWFLRRHDCVGLEEYIARLKFRGPEVSER